MATKKDKRNWELIAQETDEQKAIDIKNGLEHMEGYGKGRVKIEYNVYRGKTYYYVLGAKIKSKHNRPHTPIVSRSQQKLSGAELHRRKTGTPKLIMENQPEYPWAGNKRKIKGKVFTQSSSPRSREEAINSAKQDRRLSGNKVRVLKVGAGQYATFTDFNEHPKHNRLHTPIVSRSQQRLFGARISSRKMPRITPKMPRLR